MSNHISVADIETLQAVNRFSQLPMISNESNNNVIIDGLENLLPEFFFRMSHTRCFLHINNLVARSLVRQFDVKEVQSAAGNNSADNENADPTGVGEVPAAA